MFVKTMLNLSWLIISKIDTESKKTTSYLYLFDIYSIECCMCNFFSFAFVILISDKIGVILYSCKVDRFVVSRILVKCVFW